MSKVTTCDVCGSDMELVKEKREFLFNGDPFHGTAMVYRCVECGFEKLASCSVQFWEEDREPEQETKQKKLFGRKAASGDPFETAAQDEDAEPVKDDLIEDTDEENAKEPAGTKDDKPAGNEGPVQFGEKKPDTKRKPDTPDVDSSTGRKDAARPDSDQNNAETVKAAGKTEKANPVKQGNPQDNRPDRAEAVKTDNKSDDTGKKDMCPKGKSGKTAEASNNKSGTDQDKQPLKAEDKETGKDAGKTDADQKESDSQDVEFDFDFGDDERDEPGSDEAKGVKEDHEAAAPDGKDTDEGAKEQDDGTPAMFRKQDGKHVISDEWVDYMLKEKPWFKNAYERLAPKETQERRFLNTYKPEYSVILNDILYDTEESELFFMEEKRIEDKLFKRYYYRTKSDRFFQISIRFGGEPELSILELKDVKRILARSPKIYRKIIPDGIEESGESFGEQAERELLCD